MAEKKATAWETKTVAVEVLGSIRKRLKAYIGAHEKLSVKAVVNEALDEYLRKRGA